MKSFSEYLTEAETKIGKSLVGTNGIKYQLPDGYIDIQYQNLMYAPRTQSVVAFVVDESMRGHGVGTKLLKIAMAHHDDICAAVSSGASLSIFYKAGFRSMEKPSATLPELQKKLQEDSAVSMAQNDKDGHPYA